MPVLSLLLVAWLLDKMYPDSHFIGIDYSEELIAYAQKNNYRKNIDYIAANIKSENLRLANGSVDKIFSWGVMYYIHPKYEYETYQLEFLRILKTSGLICHFQIPLRYSGLCNLVDISKNGIAVWFKYIKKYILDVFVYKYNDYAYKFSKHDLCRYQSNILRIKIIPDDFFHDRISVIYKR